MSDIHALLHQVQKNLSVPKERTNSFAKYNYRNCEDILEGLKKALPPGCSVTISDDIVLVGDRHYIKATATFHHGLEFVSVSAFAREALEKKGNDPAQITGATSSYARKYALNGLFAIDDNADADHDEKGHAAQQTKPQGYQQEAANNPNATITNNQELELSALIHKAGIEMSKYCQSKGLSRLRDMAANDYAANRAKLQRFINEKEQVAG